MDHDTLITTYSNRSVAGAQKAVAQRLSDLTAFGGRGYQLISTGVLNAAEDDAQVIVDTLARLAK